MCEYIIPEDFSMDKYIFDRIRVCGISFAEIITSLV